MSRGFKIALVVMALIFEFWFLAGFCNPYPHGMIGDVKYRRTERLAAFRDFTLSRSAETKTVFDRELVLMHRHEDWKMYLTTGLLLAVNAAAIYLFLRRERKSRVA